MTSAQCDIELEDLHRSLESLDSVDPEVMQEYYELKRDIESIEAQTARFETHVKGQKTEMDAIKARWLENLNDLISKLAGR